MSHKSTGRLILNTIVEILKLLTQVFTLLYAFIGWVVIIPIAAVIPKKKNLIAFIGIYNGNFSGNVKYLYLYLQQTNYPEIDCYYLAENFKTYRTLKKNRLPVVFYPSIKGIIKLLRTNVVIVDSNKWISHFKCFLLFKSKKVQLWHGLGIKKIEVPIIREKMKRSLSRRLRYTLINRLPKYDLLVSSSEFFSENKFKDAFYTKKIIEAGYPRNDVFFSPPVPSFFLETDTVTNSKILQKKKKGAKIILYAPTFRDTRIDMFHKEKNAKINLERLNRFAEKNNFLLVFKFHPIPSQSRKFAGYSHIIIYDNSKDIYPSLPLFDLLITDYSSIYMDFLLVDKPVIFFPYDYDFYIKNNRSIIFDYQ